MSFLLDTCVVSELAKLTPDPNVVRWIDEQPADSLFLSVLTVGEIEKGLAALAAGARRRALGAWLAALRATYADRLLAIGEEIAVLWGRLAAAAEATGTRLPVVDGLIAATAIHHGYTVVTRNVADFAPSGATVLDPWTG